LSTNNFNRQGWKGNQQVKDAGLGQQNGFGGSFLIIFAQFAEAVKRHSKA
jgi:hypothetical protein